MAALVTPIVLALRAEIRGSSRRGGFGLAECNFFPLCISISLFEDETPPISDKIIIMILAIIYRVLII